MLIVDSDIRTITAKIKKWCDEVHPDRTAIQMMEKLQEEFLELIERPMDAYEMADIAIILFDLCEFLGFDVATIVHRKMEINKLRTWHINSDGILKHGRKEITQMELKDRLCYDPKTGLFSDKKGNLKGTVHKDGGLVITVAGNQYQAHRLAFLYMEGSTPKQYTDHINGIRTDNRWINLRKVSPEDNCRNMAMSTKNTSGRVGVSAYKGRWKASIKVKGKTVHLGYHDTLEKASAARDKAELKYGFHKNHGRKKAQ